MIFHENEINLTFRDKVHYLNLIKELRVNDMYAEKGQVITEGADSYVVNATFVISDNMWKEMLKLEDTLIGVNKFLMCLIGEMYKLPAEHNWLIISPHIIVKNFHSIVVDGKIVTLQ